MAASLLIDAPGNWAINHTLKDQNRLGRAEDCDIKIQGTTVSSRHAMIWKAEEDGRWYIKDLNSKNGTYVQGRKIDQERLSNGANVKLGSLEMVFRNPEEAPEANPGATMWGDTAVRFERDAESYRQKVQSGTGDDVIELSGLLAGPMSGEQLIADASSKNMKAAPAAPADEEAEDGLWVAEKLAELLAEMATHKDEDKETIFAKLLQSLRGLIDAENGFLMIPNRQTKQWVIRAWVGDEEDWNPYEREHPLSLTVANRAWKDRKIVTSSKFGGAQGIDPSESLQKLKVSSYVAVPLEHNGERAGVLYYDTRRSQHSFLPRHIRLLHRMAAYIIQLEFQDD